jgi:hypothetical protein
LDLRLEVGPDVSHDRRVGACVQIDPVRFEETVTFLSGKGKGVVCGVWRVWVWVGGVRV